MALYQKCVHLGCRVPFCQTSQWFECPCHGSKYNEAGEYQLGPAPTGLNRFKLTIDERHGDRRHVEHHPRAAARDEHDAPVARRTVLRVMAAGARTIDARAARGRHGGAGRARSRSRC